ncbi:hypothetical protein J6590_039336 [Homalodisca vitripennis]|nr:hypothetical protein J6590_039336 [Homalodisca vitripennis]
MKCVRVSLERVSYRQCGKTSTKHCNALALISDPRGVPLLRCSTCRHQCSTAAQPEMSQTHRRYSWRDQLLQSLPSQYAMAGGQSLLWAGSDKTAPVPLQYFVIPVPESTRDSLDNMEITFHEREGFRTVLLGYLKRGMLMTMFLSFLTVLGVYGMLWAFGGDANNGGGRTTAWRNPTTTPTTTQGIYLTTETRKRGDIL